ncbi:hypothetical protein DUNSADRAFT_13781 [Dunaliella salina]|uniref:Encoded protein n=1 Tax=Dunaliella salina TaxID=3046 RepID=A0ABQ7G8N3_DUNSA|nr:hypothetical protein DUNSADRAFT_13781 [Dunaliella salina]|eukprot:KAF5830971.1 hypothetical protein DUNSADRAFT_13781 [Dunaliella salina]
MSSSSSNSSCCCCLPLPPLFFCSFHQQPVAVQPLPLLSRCDFCRAGGNWRWGNSAECGPQPFRPALMGKLAWQQRWVAELEGSAKVGPHLAPSLRAHGDLADRHEQEQWCWGMSKNQDVRQIELWNQIHGNKWRQASGPMGTWQTGKIKDNDVQDKQVVESDLREGMAPSLGGHGDMTGCDCSAGKCASNRVEMNGRQIECTGRVCGCPV